MSKVAERRAWEEADKVVEKIKATLDEAGVNRFEWEMCGSYRRGRPTVGDLDLVVLDKAFEVVSKALAAIATSEERLKKDGSIRTVTIEGMRVEFYTTTVESWGAQLCHSTGSKEENIRLRAIARSQGRMINQYGCWEEIDQQTSTSAKDVTFTDKQGCRWIRIAGKTEEDMYAALDEQFVKPADRDPR